MANYYFDILETIETPEIIYAGEKSAKIAVKNVPKEENKFVVVIYRDSIGNDGFVITAYLTKKLRKFSSKEVLWKEQK